MSINKVVVTGNLTRDAELRETQNGFQVLGFGVAVSDRKKNQLTGQWEDWTNFVDCTMFGNRAASVAGFLLKGTKVAIEGKLRWSQWQAQDGSKRSKLEVVVDELEFMAPGATARPRSSVPSRSPGSWQATTPKTCRSKGPRQGSEAMPRSHSPSRISPAGSRRHESCISRARALIAGI